MAQFRRYSGFRNADPVATESRIVILTGVAGRREAGGRGGICNRGGWGAACLVQTCIKAGSMHCVQAPWQCWRPLTLADISALLPSPLLPAHADEQPNMGDFSSGGLLARVKANALDGIHTTFIGEHLGLGPGQGGRARGAGACLALYMFLCWPGTCYALQAASDSCLRCLPAPTSAPCPPWPPCPPPSRRGPRFQHLPRRRHEQGQGLQLLLGAQPR